MIKRLFSIAIFTTFVLLTACQTKEQVDIPTSANTETNSNEKVNAKDPAQEDENQITEEERIRNLFLDELKIDMSESEVRGLFGTNFSFIENSLSMDGKETWRYDLGTQQGYEFDDQGIDQVDMEGLKKGDIQQQLFIDWSSDGKVVSAALYMRSEAENGYYEYELFPDHSRVEKLYHFD